MEGYLMKWVNYVYGWKRRYFVLHNGVVYYCKDRGERSKGVIHLNVAQVVPHPKNNKRLQIDTGCTVVHLKAETAEECRQWLKALKDEQLALVQMAENHELREADSPTKNPNSPSGLQVMAAKLGSVWTLQAQFEEQLDLLSPAVRANPQLTAISAVALNLKNSIVEIMTVIEEEQSRMKKVNQALEDKQEQLRKGLEDYMMTGGQTGSRSLGTSPFQMERGDDRMEDVDDPEFQDAMSHVSDDMFYDAKEEMSVIIGDELDNRPFRKCLPVLRNPKQRINIWKIIKDSIGQELSKIAVPVYFNEPLSFLQRFTEDFTYHELITTACAQTDSCLRLAYIACWIVSQYSFTSGRTMKPFNPLLGETFELEQGGMKIISEQVSHHPPVSALHCDHPKFASWGNTEVKSSFKGTFLLVAPTGLMHIMLKEWNDHITWNKPQTSVHNIILGKVYVDHHGHVVLANQTTQDTCNLHMKKMGWFDKNPHSVEATIFDSRGVVRYTLTGKWDESMTLKDARTGESKVLWEAAPFPEGYETNYFFTNFTLQLNIPPVAYLEPIAPSDSRYRPDQRALENGDIKTATGEKIRVEEKQRKARKDRADLGEEYAPRWFSLRNNEWVYHGGYWEAKDSNQFTECPDIF